jgi:hypothetical protein
LPELGPGIINDIDCEDGWVYSGQLLEKKTESGSMSYKRHGLGRL